MNQLATVDMATGEIVEADIVELAREFREAHKSHVDSVRHLYRCGEILKRRKGELGHGSWLPWLERNEDALGFGERTAQRMIGIYEKNPTLTTDLAPAQALLMNRKVWGNDNHRAQGTGENEWYTPAQYIDAARHVLGGIDVDPASSDLAQEVVSAATFYTVADNGLLHDWRGSVWMNPPYSQPHIQLFIEKLVTEVRAGRATAAIALTHNYTDTEWFHIAARACSAMCFTRGRIKFVNPEGEEASPTQGQAFFYFGDKAAYFCDVFSNFGFVVVRP